jgi:hypothetical protein
MKCYTVIILSLPSFSVAVPEIALLGTATEKGGNDNINTV